MKKFYFTFGNSRNYPYQGGYLVVKAIDRDDAVEKYRKKYPDVHKNTVNCAFVYTEDEWKDINLGQSLCHEVIDCRFKLLEAKLVDMAHFKMYEGKFQDMEQMKNGVEVYIYANVSTFEAYTFEESEIKVYAHPFEDLYYADESEIYQLELNRIYTNELKDVLITNYNEAISKEKNLKMMIDFVKIDYPAFSLLIPYGATKFLVRNITKQINLTIEIVNGRITNNGNDVINVMKEEFSNKPDILSKIIAFEKKWYLNAENNCYRYIKFISGMTTECEIIKTNAPDSLIVAQIVYTAKREQNGEGVNNAYDLLEKMGYIVELTDEDIDDDQIDEVFNYSDYIEE